MHQTMSNPGRSLALVILLTLAALLAAACTMPTDSAESDMAEAAEPVSHDPIIFSDLNWQSALIQNRIAQYLVEKGYGYPTGATFGATLPLFQGLRNGDTHVTL